MSSGSVDLGPTVNAGSGSGSGSSSPTGAAGGDLGGTYPNPTVISVADVITGLLPVANLASMSFTNISGALPVSRTTGSISLTNQVVGILPAANTTTLDLILGSVSLTTQVAGILPAANITTLNLILGSVSLSAQTSGLLPVASLSSLSFTNISGTLTVAQTSGSVSLTNKVSGILPTANGGTGAASLNAAGVWVNGTSSFGIASNIGTGDTFPLGIFTNNTTRIYVTSSGSVGLGTSAPDSLFEVRRDQNASTGLRVSNYTINGSAGTTVLLISGTANSTAQDTLNDNNGSPYRVIGVGAGVTATYYDSPIHVFRTQGGTETVRFDGSGNVSIGTAGAGALSRLDVSGGTAIGSYAGVTAAPANSLIVSANVGIGTALPISQLDVRGRVTSYSISGSSSATIAANSGAGASPTVSLTGNSLAGQVSVTAGATASNSSSIVTVTFSSTSSTAPFVVFCPANAPAAQLCGSTSVFVSSSTSGFQFTSGSTGLVSTIVYKWNFHVIG